MTLSETARETRLHAQLKFEADVAAGRHTVRASSLLSDLDRSLREGEDCGVSTGWSSLDDLYRVARGTLVVVTGVPTHGKSSWLDCLCMKLAVDHGWKFSLFSPENKPYRLHLRKLAELLVGLPLRRESVIGPEILPAERIVKACEFVGQHFLWADYPQPTLAKLLAIWNEHSREMNPDGFVLDPWNEMEHQRQERYTETEYISYCLSTLREYARVSNAVVFVVAHPAKMQRDRNTGNYPVPSLWDISGSAHWRAKADVGVVIHREDITQHNLDVHVQKVRFKQHGKPGSVRLSYDWASGRMYDGA